MKNPIRLFTTLDAGWRGAEVVRQNFVIGFILFESFNRHVLPRANPFNHKRIQSSQKEIWLRRSNYRSGATAYRSLEGERETI